MFVLIAVLSWRWVVSMSRPLPPAKRLIWILMIAGPAFVIARLFPANWLKLGDAADC